MHFCPRKNRVPRFITSTDGMWGVGNAGAELVEAAEVTNVRNPILPMMCK